MTRDIISVIFPNRSVNLRTWLRILIEAKFLDRCKAPSWSACFAPPWWQEMWQISSFSVLLAGELSLDLQVLWHTWSQAFQGFVFSFSNPVFLGETSHVSLEHSFVSGVLCGNKTSTGSRDHRCRGEVHDWTTTWSRCRCWLKVHGHSRLELVTSQTAQYTSHIKSLPSLHMYIYTRHMLLVWNRVIMMRYEFDIIW